jgi:hypothetical protein
MRGQYLVVLTLASCGERRAEPPPARGDAASAAAPAPVVTTPLAPLDDAHLDALAQLAPPGFEVTARDRSATSIVIALRAGDLRATVSAIPCTRCTPMDLAAWRTLEPELRALLPGGLEDDPATTFELTTADIAGRRCIAGYELGAASYTDELDTTHGARVYCNDGATELVVRVDDDAVARAATPDAARATAQRVPLETAARNLAAAYLSALK